MRVAVDGSEEVGARTARVLYAEESVTYIGSMGSTQHKLGSRSGPVGDLADYDVIVSDGATHTTGLIARASVLGIPLVLWGDEPDLHRGPASSPVVAAANLGSALAPSLVHHPSSSITGTDKVTIAWTEPGKPYRRGQPITFPDPVGPMWARRRSEGHLVARTSSEWGGAVIIARGTAGERIVGVSDHAGHLEAITLAAVTMLAAVGVYDAQIQDAVSRSQHLLNRAMDMELDVAVWRSTH